MDMYQAALKKIGDKAVISVGNAEALPYEEEVFHMVMTTDTCYFWENPQRVLSEIYRTLKRNGLFVNSYNTMYAAAVAGSNRDALADDASIIAAAKQAGFLYVKIKKIGLLERQIVLKKPSGRRVKEILP